MKEIKVSVIIPIYNSSKYLEECLDSVLNQTMKDIEIIMIDDGSTDCSYEIARQYAQSDTRFTLIHTENRGQSAARNTGLDIAKGEYIYFLDSDDFLSSEALGVLYNFAQKNELDILKFSSFVFEDEKREYIWRHCQDDFGYKYEGKYEGVYSGIDLFGMLIENNDCYPCVPMELIRKNLLDCNSIRFLEGVILEDNLFDYEIMVSAIRVGVLNNPLYYRRIRPGSTMTGNQWMRKIQSISVIIYKIEKRIVANDRELKNGSWLIASLFEMMKLQWERMTVKEQYSSLTKECFKSIKGIVLNYNNSKRNRLFFFSFSLYKLYRFIYNTKMIND